MNNRRSYCFICIVLCVLCLNISFAVTIYVPSDQPTIQAGIDAAQDGDTVLVADGTYKGEGNVNIDFMGKEITIKSANGANTTIVDCQSTPETRGFIFQNQETNKAVLEGFTIRNGIHDFGGGIHIYDASPTINNCVISDNEATGKLLRTDGGGGIYLYNSDAIILDCIISNNNGTGILIAGDWDKDGIVLRETRAEPSILNSKILDNDGKGVFCTNFVSPLINQCIVSQNTDTGIEYNHHARTETPITNCTITRNMDGGIAVHEVSALEIKNSIITFNEAKDGGGIYCSPTSVLYAYNCIIAENTATREGGGITVDSTRGSAEIVNCTITRNIAHERGGAVSAFVEFGGLEINNSIVWGNNSFGTHDELSAISIFGRTVIKSCVIRHGLDGIGREPDDWFVYENNIDEDPLFIDPENGDFRLMENSPAAAMGANAIFSDGNPLTVTAKGKRISKWAEFKRR
ncbi:hypothetical protein F4X73_09865 [Candidatus Poribacteria bacterium]|nr:hypothetical protein [Candidatus Poribacteria bacterium]